MRKPLIRGAAALFVGLLAAMLVAPVGTAFADTTVKGVKSLDEAWFFRYRQPLEPVPDIDDPTANNPDDIAKSTVRERTNPYPVDTFHVGVNGGQVEAVTYLNWDTYALNGNNGLEAIITGGTVTFTDAGTTCAPAAQGGPQRSCGSRRPEAAKMVACRATELVVEAQGGDFRDKYKYDVKDCTPLKPQPAKEGEPLQWKADLAQFADTWSDPFKNTGIAIVPAPEAVAGDAPTAPQESWHVAFHGRRTDVENAKIITSDLTIKKQVLDIPDFGGGFGPVGGGFTPTTPTTPTTGGGSTFTPSTGGGSTFTPSTGGSTGSSFTPSTGTSTVTSDTSVPVDTGVAAESAPAAAPPVAAPVAAPQTQPVNAPGPQTPKAIWLLPFLALSLAGALGWSLSQPVELANEREGAVSKLMKARRFGGRASA